MGVKNIAFVVIFTISSLMIGKISYAGNEQKSRELLLQLGPFAQEAAVSPDIMVRRPLGQTVAIIGEKRVARPPPRQRDPKLSPDQIVVVGLDSEGQELSRTLVPDPRFIRTETLDSSDRLVSGQMYLENAKLSVVLPDDPALKEIRLYHPEWTGSRFTLELIGKMLLP